MNINWLNEKIEFDYEVQKFWKSAVGQKIKQKNLRIYKQGAKDLEESITITMEESCKQLPSKE